MYNKFSSFSSPGKLAVIFFTMSFAWCSIPESDFDEASTEAEMQALEAKFCNDTGFHYLVSLIIIILSRFY